jgi:hypothetical protein
LNKKGKALSFIEGERGRGYAPQVSTFMGILSKPPLPFLKGKEGSERVALLNEKKLGLNKGDFCGTGIVR